MTTPTAPAAGSPADPGVRGGRRPWLLVVGVCIVLAGVGLLVDRVATSHPVLGVATGVVPPWNNLTDALTEADAVTGSSSAGFSGLTAAQLTSGAPEFEWLSTPCLVGGAANCISWAVVDVARPGDAAGVVVARVDPTGGRCLFGLYAEVDPATAPGVPELRLASPWSARTYFFAEAPRRGDGCRAAGAAPGLTWYPGQHFGIGR